jgi:hypothetical protein
LNPARPRAGAAWRNLSVESIRDVGDDLPGRRSQRRTLGAVMLKFLWKLTSDDEQAEDTMAVLTVAFSLVALGWLMLA